jgi:hypothetical protein
MDQTEKPGIRRAATEPPGNDKRRSQRVVLQIAVLVKTRTPHNNADQVQARTLVVNAHGGLLEGPLMVVANQKITIVNPRTRAEVHCRVVRVERPSSMMATVAFEFHEPTAQFWPITFPPEDWGATAS